MLQPQRDDDPRALRKKIAELEKQLRDQQDLIRLLAELPKPRCEPLESTTTPAAKTRRGKRASPREVQGGELSPESPPKEG